MILSGRHSDKAHAPTRLRALGLCAALAFAFGLAAPANAACRLALALALDVSGSVNAREYRQQTHGIARALGDPAVQSILFQVPEVPVYLAIYEWSAASYQRLILDWTPLTGPADVTAVQNRLMAWEREEAPEATGVGAALEYGAQLMTRAPLCWDQTLDISADGKNNDWPLPHRLRISGRLGTMNVNALVVADDSAETQDRTYDGVAELSAYFQARIIYGPSAFVEVALGYQDYARAMTQKLLRELATRPLGAAPQPPSADTAPIRAAYAPSRQ